MKITAAVVERKSGSFVLQALELEAPRNGEILVRMVAAGIRTIADRRACSICPARGPTARPVCRATVKPLQGSFSGSRASRPIRLRTGTMRRRFRPIST
ncbi:hypothetical protein [Burkholderia lata]|uniref:hypothetical protein n=1 Tax=Burkholderia lata (strain ATCC 17760 / DSM 23089 / LMG 22485 / NCIMB 9086 / R18194 / 383) TaxID=482957 RepID=UPI0012FD2FD2|nr:hypothetical protein [Burkholderia lata]